jgi:hypothetical protein
MTHYRRHAYGTRVNLALCSISGFPACLCYNMRSAQFPGGRERTRGPAARAAPRSGRGPARRARAARPERGRGPALPLDPPAPPSPGARPRAPRLILAEVQLGERGQRSQARRKRERAAVAQLVLAQREAPQARLPPQPGRQRARAGRRHLVQRELQLLQLRDAVRQRLRPARTCFW